MYGIRQKKKADIKYVDEQNNHHILCMHKLMNLNSYAKQINKGKMKYS